MKNIVGIIAEYNPFHNGHLHHIKETKKNVDAPIIVALSANFVQRGLPAFCGKWARAQMALENGANLVVEIPTFYACNGGMIFAQAVDILNALGVSHLSFGVEDFDSLDKISSILAQEPPSFKQSLRAELSKGASYSKAVSLAVGADITPNNALALSYISRIKRKNYKIIPLPIQRQGLGHHESASEIRKMFGENFDKIFEFLQIVFLSREKGSLRNIDGMGEGLEGLFSKHIGKSDSFDDFVGRCVCARYTRSRIQRQIIKILLGIDKFTAAAMVRTGPRYVRVLGYDETGRDILRGARKSPLEIVTKLALVKDKIGREIARIEFKSEKLYDLVLGAGTKTWY